MPFGIPSIVMSARFWEEVHLVRKNALVRWVWIPKRAPATTARPPYTGPVPGAHCPHADWMRL